jgi:hypothetical protein
MRRLLLALVAWLAVHPLAAHVLWIIPGDLVVGGDGVVVLLQLERGQAASFAPGRWVPADPAATGGATVAFVASGSWDGDGLPGTLAAVRAGLRLDGRMPDGVERLPDQDGMVVLAIAWRGTGGDQRLSSRLWEGQPVIATLDLRVIGVPGRDRLQVLSEGFLPIEAPALAATAAATPDPGPWRTAVHMTGQGFLHILPQGLDHVLFVLGLFLAVRRWGPLLLQITAFTAAHTLTLALAASGVLVLPAQPVEVLIAASIAVVGIENAWRPEPGRWRVLVVFLFGLVHGLGFAGVMGELDWSRERLVPVLVGFNVGVELGQLAVVAGAGLLLAWWWSRDWYRRAVAIPASLLISAVALVWTVQRIVG